ncbi:MAG: PfkB family carbohydrate kinase, partial [Candidatus Omnitrophica bacterium]|nr:PfkB family carbohydrate kinase [Candidatus Omnitrophota bacterium]
MELKKGCSFALLVPTSMGIRLTPEDNQPVHCATRFIIQATSAESNVASVVSYLGLPVKVLTALVKGSPIARFIKDNLASRHMLVEAKEVPQGGPWGYRHQINIADTGYGSRAPRVWNDRSGEVGRTMKAEDFDLERIFGQEGVQVVHLSGLIGALSPETGHFCLEIARTAKKYGTRLSFDLNYRASFWKNREKELRAIFSEIASLADILVGNEEDFQLCLGIEGPETGGKGLAGKIDGFKGMIEQAQRSFPQASVFATTLREVISCQQHLWGAIMSFGSDWYVVEPREIFVL